MPCDTKLKPKQTIQQRAAEVRATVTEVAKGLAMGKIKPVVSNTGAIAFAGLLDAARDGVTDACIYRRIMTSGSSAAKLAIARAEQLAGRSVSRTTLAAGVHSHDGGTTWHQGH